MLLHERLEHIIKEALLDRADFDINLLGIEGDEEVAVCEFRMKFAPMSSIVDAPEKFYHYVVDVKKVGEDGFDRYSVSHGIPEVHQDDYDSFRARDMLSLNVLTGLGECIKGKMLGDKE